MGNQTTLLTRRRIMRWIASKQQQGTPVSVNGGRQWGYDNQGAKSQNWGYYNTTPMDWKTLAYPPVAE